MPDAKGETKADEETLPQTSLHAYKEGEDRKEDLKGDPDTGTENESAEEGGATPKH